MTEPGGLLSRQGLSDLSRRDNRTQPGVSTPGTDKKNVRPEVAVQPRLPERTFDQKHLTPPSIPNPLRGCNSNLAHYSNTTILHHSAGPDSRTSLVRFIQLKRTIIRNQARRLARSYSQSGVAHAPKLKNGFGPSLMNNFGATIRTTTRTRTKRLVRACRDVGMFLGLKPQAESYHPFGIKPHSRGRKVSNAVHGPMDHSYGAPQME